MEHFLSCDWGTSSFRIRLAETENGKVIAEEKTSQGIADTFSSWKEACNPDDEKRLLFYLNIIQQHIKEIELKIDYSLDGVKLIISGMASSSIGFINIPYNLVPLAVDGSGIKTAAIAANKNFKHCVLIISGVRTGDDVMRGEETQLMGCIDSSAHAIKNELFIFPGTHSKHIRVKDDQIVGFKTYMTGEFFEFLSQKSILRNTVEVSDEPPKNVDIDSFKKGVKDAGSSNLLHIAFKVRTNQLFGVFTKKENFNYLSGLLIGAELNDLRSADAKVINLLCGSNLAIYYQSALREMGLSQEIRTFPTKWVDEAAVRGHLKIGKQLKILA